MPSCSTTWRKERNSSAEILERRPPRLRAVDLSVRQHAGRFTTQTAQQEDYFAYPNGLVLRRTSYESLMPNEVVGYSTQPVELFGVAPMGSVIGNLFPRGAQWGDCHTLAVLDLYSDRRYDIYWDDQGHVRRLGDDATLQAISRSAGCMVLPFREKLLFAVLGQASGFPPEKNQLIDHCTPGAEGGTGWGAGLWDHWPIGWLNSQTSLWKPGSPYAYSFGSVGHHFVPDGKRIKSFSADYSLYCQDMELNRWNERRTFHVLLGTAGDWDDIQRISHGWLNQGEACTRPDSVAGLR